VLLYKESLGKRKRKKKSIFKNGGLGNVPHGTEKLGEGTGMEGSGKEISMREYPLSRQDNRTAAVADSIYVYLLLEWMVEFS